MSLPSDYSYSKVYFMDNQIDDDKYFYRGNGYFCSLELAMDIIGGKWKTMMIYYLKDGALRSSDLQRCLRGISNKMFTQTARELERDRIIEWIVYPVVPPKVEYRLSELGSTIIALIMQMSDWGMSVSETGLQGGE